jgi:hypothetical protein
VQLQVYYASTAAVPCPQTPRAPRAAPMRLLPSQRSTAG